MSGFAVRKCRLYFGCFGGLRWWYWVEKDINRFLTMYFPYLILKFETAYTSIYDQLTIASK